MVVVPHLSLCGLVGSAAAEGQLSEHGRRGSEKIYFGECCGDPERSPDGEGPEVAGEMAS